MSEYENKTQEPMKKTSSEWLHDGEFKNTEILEPLGWFEENWVDDFSKLKITKEEFTIRLMKSKFRVSK